MKRLPWTTVLPLIIFLLLATTLGLALLHSGQTPKFATHLDDQVPATNLPILGDSATFFNTNDWHGHPYIINFFASWCLECQAEHEQLMTLADKHIPLIGIALEDKPIALLHFLAKLGNPFVAIADDNKGSTAMDWGLTGVPETFVIDAEGVIRFHYVGPITDKVIEHDILPLWWSVTR